MPEKAHKAYDAVKALYPEVDYSLLTAKKEKYFKTPEDPSRVEELFLSLLTHGYIAKNTHIWQFRKIFSIEDIDRHPFKPVKWMKELRKLSYFLHFALGMKYKDVWVKAQYCFTVNGKTPNRGSLKSAFGAMKRDHPDWENFDPCLRGIALQFCRD